MQDQTTLARVPRERLISRKELAQRWGVSLETIKRRSREGLLRPRRFNARLIRYSFNEVLAIEKEAEGEPPQRKYAFSPEPPETPNTSKAPSAPKTPKRPAKSETPSPAKPSAPAKLATAGASGIGFRGFQVS